MAKGIPDVANIMIRLTNDELTQFIEEKMTVYKSLD